ncbi:DUF1345 domain-containing protein [Dietzia sp.]|uniref:DUF1345 domain-containing protein n=1 Tax=Dietzia sp. TaxID=1871616 RepID=UPI002FDA9104
MSYFFRRRDARFARDEPPARRRGYEENSGHLGAAAGSTEPTLPRPAAHPRVRRSRIRFVAMFVVGLAVMFVASPALGWMVAPAAGWFVAAVLYDVLVWRSISRMDAEETRKHAQVEDPSRAARELLLLSVNVASIIAVVILIVATSHVSKHVGFAYAVLALATVAASWVLLHTMFTLRYAALYYSVDPPDGVYFNENKRPCYADFAYIAFTIGMSFAVSDPAVITTEFRKLVLQHTFLAYIYGTTIVATTVSLIVGLF